MIARILPTGLQASPAEELVNSPSRIRNNEALNSSSIAADIREPRYECPEGHDDRRGAHRDYKSRTRAHVRARQTTGCRVICAPTFEDS